MSQIQEINRPADQTKSEQEQQEVRVRAYELYLQRGGEHGHDAEDWLRAEEEIRHSRTHRKAA
jgi:hypothetical protein